MRVTTDQEALCRMIRNREGIFAIGCLYFPEHNTDYGDWLTIGMPLKRRDMAPEECDEDDYRAVYLGFAMDNPVVGVRRDMEAVRIYRLEIFEDCVEMRLHWEVDLASMPEGLHPYWRNPRSIWD